MHLYANGHLIFGVLIDPDARGVMESRKLHEFDKENGSDLGYLTSGSFSEDDLYLTAYHAGAEPGDPARIGPHNFSRKNRTIWKRQIEKFLRENQIEAFGEIGLWIIADLDN
jgi:hypothetical protein